VKGRLAALLLGVSLAAACGGDSTPAAPSPPACQTDHTGTITVTNNGSATVDILWNNAFFTTLSPGQTSRQMTVVANGPQYVLDSVITNTSIHPCQILVATPAQCQNTPYTTCRF
jgi:hypothetical protein